jgi:hypothetical protein
MDSTKPPQGRRKSESLLIVLGIALIVLVLVVHASTYWYQETVSRSVAPGKPEVLGRSEGLVALAWVDKGGIESDGVLRLWILLENRTEAEVRNLRVLVFHTPGFEKVGSCWSNPGPDGAPACRPGSGGAPARLGLPATLGREESVVRFASLKSKVWYGYHGASGVVAWQDAAGKNWESAFALPAVQVSPVWGRALFGLSKSLDVFKDLALPLALLVLGWYLQRRDKEREREREERDRSQAMLRETWSLMLPKLHGYAEKHYMPVAASAFGFRDALRRQNHPRSFFELLRLLRQMNHLARTMGGLYFQDLAGEAVASQCWDLFLNRARDVLVDADRAMLEISPDENYASFTEKLAGNNQSPQGALPLSDYLKTLDRRFSAWREKDDFQQDLALLTLFEYILSYETNRPYEAWYGVPASRHFPVNDFQEALSKLGPAHQELRRDLAAYLKRIVAERERLPAKGESGIGELSRPGSVSPSLPPEGDNTRTQGENQRGGAPD